MLSHTSFTNDLKVATSFTPSILDTQILIFGTDLKVPTLNGEEKVKIPAGSKVDSMFRLKGRGLPSYGNRSKGDMVIKLAVGIPTKLSERQRWLLEELHKSGNI